MGVELGGTNVTVLFRKKDDFMFFRGHFSLQVIHHLVIEVYEGPLDSSRAWQSHILSSMPTPPLAQSDTCCENP